jgi:membrane protease YdiL (CAAX protease family)
MSFSLSLPPVETPAPEAPPQPTRRIPHFGHAALFVLTAVIVFYFIQLALKMLGLSPVIVRGGSFVVQYPKLQIAAEAGTYLLTLAAGWLFFPLLWNRRFIDGIRWNFFAVRQHASRLVGLGLLLGVMMQVATQFIIPPKSLPIDEFFASAADAWLMTFFGVIVAPVFEEICFRGFLVPAFAIAYDWVTLSRTDEARSHWQTSTTLTPLGLLFSAILTSILFALLHAQQLDHLWAAVLLLFSVSLVLTLVRIRTQSVAASALVHASYNSFIFIATMIGTGFYRHLDRLHH